MGKLSNVLRNGTEGMLFFQCPGCKTRHGIRVGDGPGPRWDWNRNVSAPTFHPSINVKGIRHDMDEETQAAYDALGPKELWGALDDPRFRTICHSFIRDGQIEFLNDCTHALAGKTVPLDPIGGE